MISTVVIWSAVLLPSGIVAHFFAFGEQPALRRTSAAGCTGHGIAVVRRDDTIVAVPFHMLVEHKVMSSAFPGAGTGAIVTNQSRHRDFSNPFGIEIPSFTIPTIEAKSISSVRPIADFRVSHRRTNETEIALCGNHRLDSAHRLTFLTSLSRRQCRRRNFFISCDLGVTFLCCI